MIASAADLVVQLARFADGRWRVTPITSIMAINAIGPDAGLIRCEAILCSATATGPG